jgi:hypothetical protein
VTDDELALVARMAFYDATKHSADPWPAVAVAVRATVIEECAKVADQWATPEQRQFGNGGPAAAIRALKEKK